MVGCWKPTRAGVRGLLEIELTCQASEADVHSGLWGNMVPDPCIALVQLVNRLVDADGRMTVGRVELTDEERAAYADVPLDEDVIREGAHLREGVDPLPRRGRTPPSGCGASPR